MKHFITILGIFTLTSIFGQDLKKIDYQIDFGTTLTIPYKKTIEIWPEVVGHPITDYSSDFGYFFEFMISYNISKKLEINSGLLYNHYKFKINDKVALTESKGDLISSYLHLPILIKYKLSENVPISFSSGPYLGLLIKANEKGTSYIDTAGFIFTDPEPIIIEPIQKYDNDIKKNYKKFDFGLSIQLDYEIKINNKISGVIFSRFNYGLIDVLKNNNAYKWKNYDLIIGFGIKI